MRPCESTLLGTLSAKKFTGEPGQFCKEKNRETWVDPSQNLFCSHINVTSQNRNISYHFLRQEMRLCVSFSKTFMLSDYQYDFCIAKNEHCYVSDVRLRQFVRCLQNLLEWFLVYYVPKKRFQRKAYASDTKQTLLWYKRRHFKRRHMWLYMVQHILHIEYSR